MDRVEEIREILKPVYAHERAALPYLRHIDTLLSALDKANAEIEGLQIANEGYSAAMNRMNCADHSFMEWEGDCPVCTNENLRAELEAVKVERDRFKRTLIHIAEESTPFSSSCNPTLEAIHTLEPEVFEPGVVPPNYKYKEPDLQGDKHD